MEHEFKNLEPFFGSWYMVELIGEGSFGKVYKIKRETFDKTQFSALKVLQIPQSQAEVEQAFREGMDDKSATSYFESLVKDITKEIELMDLLKGNSNVVSYEDHQIIKKKAEIGWIILIRMELLTSLNSYISQNTLTQNDVITLGIDICRALELCREENIIHRDIKPDNIFVSKNKSYKLGDFGIARRLEQTMSGLSKKGTYTYMAPEVYQGKPYNASVDIFSLGMVMYRLLNDNRAPFLLPYPSPITFGDREAAQNRQMSGEKMPPPQNADGNFAEIILKACAYNPAERFENPTQMQEALMRLDTSNAKVALPTQQIETETAPPIVTPFIQPTHAPAADEKTESIFGNTQGHASEGTTVSLHNLTAGYTMQSQNPFSPGNPQNTLPMYGQPLQPIDGMNYNKAAANNAYYGTTAYAQNSHHEQKRKKKSGKNLIIGILSALLVIIFAVMSTLGIHYRQEISDYLKTDDSNSTESIEETAQVSTGEESTTSPTATTVLSEITNLTASQPPIQTTSAVMTNNIAGYPAAVTYSSCIPDANGRSFTGISACDSNLDSCWLVNAGTAGAGAWLQYDFNKTMCLSGIGVVNGNMYINPAKEASENDNHLYNGQIQKFKIIFDDGSSYTYTADFNDSRSAVPQNFYFGSVISTKSVRLEVISGYQGQKYPTNIALAEFKVYQ